MKNQSHGKADNHSPETSHNNHVNQERDDVSDLSKELITRTYDFTAPEEQEPTVSSSYDQNINGISSRKATESTRLLIFSRHASVVIEPSAIHPLHITSYTSHFSVNPQPESLFLLALAKLNESSINLALPRDLRNINATKNPIDLNLPEPSPPDSLTSAPPSYSFVLRQMTARRRPRLMGTFIPSPSFVQHPPPPNYAAAFDIYVDNTVPPPTTRVYNFGFTPMPVICTECGYTGMTTVRTKITLCTHLCAFVLCVFCCWLCAPLPYVLRSCKEVYHYCRNCRNYLGMYCPTHPEHNYTQPV